MIHAVFPLWNVFVHFSGIISPAKKTFVVRVICFSFVSKCLIPFCIKWAVTEAAKISSLIIPQCSTWFATGQLAFRSCYHFLFITPISQFLKKSASLLYPNWWQGSTHCTRKLWGCMCVKWMLLSSHENNRFIWCLSSNSSLSAWLHPRWSHGCCSLHITEGSLPHRRYLLWKHEAFGLSQTRKHSLYPGGKHTLIFLRSVLYISSWFNKIQNTLWFGCVFECPKQTKRVRFMCPWVSLIVTFYRSPSMVVERPISESFLLSHEKKPINFPGNTKRQMWFTVTCEYYNFLSSNCHNLVHTTDGFY